MKKIVVLLVAFSLTSLFAAVSLSLTATPSAVAPQEEVTYVLTIRNTGRNWIMPTQTVVVLPDGFTYVNNSTYGATNSNPYINGNQLTWTNWFLMWSGEKVVINFKATTSLKTGDFGVYVGVTGYRISQTQIGPTATVNVQGTTAPLLVLNKSVDKSTGLPGEQLTYTLTYVNSGDGDATSVMIYETIGSNTDYVPGTAAGNNMTVTYSHDGGLTYNNEETLPVTDLLFTLNGNLEAGGSGNVIYKVVVK